MSSPQPTVVTALVRFDHLAGPIVQSHYPDDASASFLLRLPTYALPDAIHKQNLDFVYFTIDAEDSSEGCFLGISCFKQCPSSIQERGCLQRAMIIALFQSSYHPLNTSAFTIMQSALSRPARLLFEREPSDEDCTGILKTLQEDATIALNVSQTNHSHSNFVFMSTLNKIVAICPDQLLILMKAMNAGAQVVIYSQASLHHLTSTVLALARFCSGPTVTLPYVPVQYFGECLQRHKHVVIGCNNAILWSRTQAHVLFDIDELEIQIEQGVWTDVLRLTRADRRFAAALKPSDEDPSIISMYEDYQRRAVRSTRCHLESESNHSNTTLDDALRDFNTSWAGIMFGFTKRRDNDDCGSDQDHAHPFHDDNDGDDVFGEGPSLNSILNSISEQTLAIGDQAQRSFWEASSRLSSWVGSLAQTESVEEPQTEVPKPHSDWTD